MTDEDTLRALTDPRDDDNQAALEKLAELAGDTAPADIPEVLARLDAIEEHIAGTSHRGEEDGIASFTRLYREITAEIGKRDDEGEFLAPGRFLARLDVQFAERYFEAIRAYAKNEGNTPRCWQVLFALRQVPDIPIANFAAAGVNAHINYDLSAALLRTWNLGGQITDDHRPQQLRDYDVINNVFSGQMDGLREEMQTWISRGRDGSIPDRMANWMADIVVRWTRQIAWDVATDVWHPDDCDAAVAKSDRRLRGMSGDLGAMILRVPLPSERPTRSTPATPTRQDLLLVGHIEAMAVGHVLPDGRELFSGVSFRVGDGAKVALVGPNGAGKTTLLRMVAGELTPTGGSIARSGGLGVMGQFIGSISDDRTLADLALSLAPPVVRAAGERLRAAEKALDAAERTQLRYADALAAWGEAGGYSAEVEFDTASVAALGLPWDRARDRPVATLSGGEQKRFALELLLRGPDEVLLLDEPDNYLDVPGKRWLEARIAESPKSVLFVSHDRELLANTAQRVVTVEAGSAWTHPGGFASWHDARVARHDRMDEQRRRWDEEREKLERLVARYKAKASHNDGMASQLQAARTRLARFLDAGAPEEKAPEQSIKMKLGGGRTGKRAIVCTSLELDGLTYPFDLEVWFGDRVAVLGANGSGKSHFLRLLARGGTDPEPGAVPASGAALAAVTHDGVARLGARVRPGHFSQTHDHPELGGRTLVDILVAGDVDRAGKELGTAMKALSRYELTGQAEQRFETLSGGQQARMMILLLELSGATLLLLDEPTDNLDLASAEALEQALEAFDGTVLAVTHDRWFTRTFDRFVVFGGDGEVKEHAEPAGS